jgi:hypothetical protein
MDEPVDFLFKKGVVNEETIQYGKLKLGECYERIIKLIQNYMDISEEKTKLITIWIIGTYVHKIFSTYPYLFINAMRGSGKTRLLGIISYLSRNGFGRVQTGITESVLFRMPQGNTLVLDEFESIGGKEKSVLREYLNACYKKGGSVQRVKKAKFQGQDEWITEQFEPYKPIAMANIWGMEEVLGDRCISLILEKSNNPAKTKMVEDFSINPEFKELNELLNRISVGCEVYSASRNYIPSWNDYIRDKYTLYTYNTYIYNTTQTTQEREEKKEERREILDKAEREEMFNKIDDLGIEGRNLELLLPLLFVSKFISQEVFEEMLLIGKNIMDEKKEEEFTESADVSLYDFIAHRESDLTYVPIKELTSGFKVWRGEEEWINEVWLGRALKRLNLVVDKKRMASGVFVNVNVAKAREKLKMFKEVDDV